MLVAHIGISLANPQMSNSWNWKFPRKDLQYITRAVFEIVSQLWPANSCLYNFTTSQALETCTSPQKCCNYTLPDFHFFFSSLESNLETKETCILYIPWPTKTTTRPPEPQNRERFSSLEWMHYLLSWGYSTKLHPARKMLSKVRLWRCKQVLPGFY